MIPGFHNKVLAHEYRLQLPASANVWVIFLQVPILSHLQRGCKDNAMDIIEVLTAKYGPDPDSGLAGRGWRCRCPIPGQCSCSRALRCKLIRHTPKQAVLTGKRASNEIMDGWEA